MYTAIVNFRLLRGNRRLGGCFKTINVHVLRLREADAFVLCHDFFFVKASASVLTGSYFDCV